MSRQTEEKYISAPIKEAQEYERKAKAIRKAEDDFWNKVIERLSELQYHIPSEELSRIVPNYSNTWADICSAYGCVSEDSKNALYSHLTSERQIDYFHRNVRLEESVASVSKQYDRGDTGVQGE